MEKTTADKITDVLDGMKGLLLYKNEKYGNSALEPCNIFYKGDSKNSILIRLDDKIQRIKNSKGEIRSNDVMDIMGYLTLLMVSMGLTSIDFDKQKD